MRPCVSQSEARGCACMARGSLHARLAWPHQHGATRSADHGVTSSSHKSSQSPTEILSRVIYAKNLVPFQFARVFLKWSVSTFEHTACLHGLLSPGSHCCLSKQLALKQASPLPLPAAAGTCGQGSSQWRALTRSHAAGVNATARRLRWRCGIKPSMHMTAAHAR